jgi:hypothetical protein
MLIYQVIYSQVEKNPWVHEFGFQVPKAMLANPRSLNFFSLVDPMI